MEYKDFIKPGVMCIHIPEMHDENLWQYDPEIVTIGKYKPYFTDGTPDPTPNEYEDYCLVEIEGYTKYDESQLRLDSLLPIIEDNGKKMLYDGYVRDVVGHDESNEYSIIRIDNEEKIVKTDELEEIRHISDLNFDELKKLREQIILGSMYYNDYHNSLGIPLDDVMDCADEFGSELDWNDELDTPENFAKFCMGELDIENIKQ